MKPFAKVKQKECEMSLEGELNYFLGLQVKQGKEGMFIYLSKYTWNLVKRFGLKNARHIVSPMSTTTKLTKEEDGKPIDPSSYKSMIVSLLYLKASQPNISFSVGICTQFQASPKESHQSVVKRMWHI